MAGAKRVKGVRAENGTGMRVMQRMSERRGKPGKDIFGAGAAVN